MGGNRPSNIYIGTAGWTIRSDLRHLFREHGTHLERYARVFNCVEINSSFYRSHKRETYRKWGACVPANFRFSVKLSRAFTQDEKLRLVGSPLRETLDGIAGLQEKWGALLVQLPPGLEFDRAVADFFFKDLKSYLGPVPVFLEPRNASWATDAAVDLLVQNKIGFVRADPDRCPLVIHQRSRLTSSRRYLRLHGSPRIYRSRYSPEFVQELAEEIKETPDVQTWCIFDNTTQGYATTNALELRRALSPKVQSQEKYASLQP